MKLDKPTPPSADRALLRLLDIMTRLRHPTQGCPWDIAQDFHSIAPYTLEEAYEVADAIECGQPDDLRGELGDLLFQVVFHAQMAEERDWFDFAAVATDIADKLERRHPHVFGDAQIADVEAQNTAWEQHKRDERASKGQTGVLAGVPLALPALTRANKLQRRASRLGLDWTGVEDVIVKLREELGELEAARAQADPNAMQAEIGDLIFTCVNLARHLAVDPESALRRASHKFEARVRYVEQQVEAAAHGTDSPDPEQLDRWWRQAKEQGL